MPENSVTLRNATRGLVVLNLPHHIVPEHATMRVVGTRLAKVAPAQVIDGKKHVTVERVLHAHKKPISGSVTLRAKGLEGDSVDVARSALKAPDVAAALRAGRVVIVEPPKPKQGEKTAAQPAASTTAPALPAADKEKTAAQPAASTTAPALPAADKE